MTIVGPAIGQIAILSRPRFQQLLGAFRVIAHIPFAAVIPSRIAMSVRDWLPPSIDNRNKRQDAPLVGRVVDTVILKVSLADGVDGAPAVEQISHALFVASRECDLETHFLVTLLPRGFATLAINRLDVLLRPRTGLDFTIEHRLLIAARRAPFALDLPHLGRQIALQVNAYLAARPTVWALLRPLEDTSRRFHCIRDSTNLIR